MLESLSEHELLIFWVQIAVLLIVAKFLGSLFRRVGLPSVLGEIGAGLVLGPSVFGRISKDGFEWFLPESVEQSAALLAVSWTGGALLLLLTGFETDINLLNKLGKPAILVTLFSLIIPLGCGLAVGYVLPDLFLGVDASRNHFALFISIALGVSSLAVVAKILSELGLMRRDFGQITMAAGAGNDFIGWILLGVFSSLASSDSIKLSDLAITIGGLAILVILAFTVGQRLVDWLLRQARKNLDPIAGLTTITIVTMLSFAVVTQWLRVEALLGAFLAGVILSRSKFRADEPAERLEVITHSYLAPLFFATAGLRVDFGELGQENALAWAGLILAVALAAKFVGAYIGTRLAGRTHRSGMAMGAGLNARGALEVVIATTGLSLGIFNPLSYAVILMVPVITLIVSSVSLRIAVRNWEGDPGERLRLEREESLDQNLVVKTSPILLLSQGGPDSLLAAQVVNYAWPIEAGVTVLTVGNNSQEMNREPLENIFYERQVEFKQVDSSDIAEAILAESRLGYGVLAMGAGLSETNVPTISPLADAVISESAIPIVVTRRTSRVSDKDLPKAFSKVLVPISAGRSSRAAAEIAFSLNISLGTQVSLIHIVEVSPDARLRKLFRGQSFEERYQGAARSEAVGRRLLLQAKEAAQNMGVKTESIILKGHSAGEELVQMTNSGEADEEKHDLLILGAYLHRVGDRPYFGSTAEELLADSEAAVVAVVVPIDI